MGAEEELQRRLRALFAEELADGLQLIGPGLLSLEERACTASGPELVQELFRAAHSLKGAAHAACVPEAIAACDRLESAFAAVRDGQQAPDPALVTRLLAETDSLAALAGRLNGAPAPTPSPGPSPAADHGRPASPPRPVPPLGAPAVPPPASGALRVTTEKVDAVLRHAGEGLAASRRLHDVVDQAVQAAELVEAARSRLHAAGREHPALTGVDVLLADAARAVTALARTVERTDRALHHTSTGVAEAVQRLRTQPFADACTSLERVVRDVATSTGKSARLTLVGGELDVDRAVITALRDPLLHLVRNAVDHGLEHPDTRAAAGKPATGTIEVVATLDGSLLQVVVRDDGAGVDTAQLREAATRRGVPLSADDEELPFLPGLSSRTEVTDVSGRGVGLDAVRARLEQLGGSVQVESRPGSGTEVRLTTPVTLAVLRVLLASAAGQVVALPTSSVERVVQVDREALREVEGQVLLVLGGRSARAVALADALGFPPAADAPDPTAQLGVVVPRGGDAVLVTDGLLDELEVAVQPVPARLAGAPGVLGITVTSSGLPAVVVNPVAVGRSASSYALQTTQAPASEAFRILLAEDTVTTRALERSILEAAGYAVAVAVDGLDAWQQLQADGADLVVSDVDMPRMSGIELCRRIRSSTRLRDLPVVLVTSLDSLADRQRGLEAGADAYVVKAELQQGSLLDTVARLL